MKTISLLVCVVALFMWVVVVPIEPSETVASTPMHATDAGIISHTVVNSLAVPTTTPDSEISHAEAHTAEGTTDFEDMDFLDDDDEEESVASKPKVIADPFKWINKPIFKFNLFFYHHIARPIVRGWEKVVPKPARTGLNNAFRNLGYPLRASASLLQWRWNDVGNETIRFVANSTGGVLGFWDIAAMGPHGIQPVYEDFGQTMGAWGMGHGFYVMLPFVGPSSLRDGAGWYGASWVHPYFLVDEWQYTLLLGVVDRTNSLSFTYGNVDTALEGSLDPYAATKHFYTVSRKQEVEE